MELPEISTIAEFTPDMVKQYIAFVATMRHNQKRYFSTRRQDALDLSKDMERKLDAFNNKMLNPVPSLFD